MINKSYLTTMLHDWPDILDLYLPGCLLQYLERWAMHQRPDL